MITIDGSAGEGRVQDDFVSGDAATALDAAARTLFQYGLGDGLARLHGRTYLRILRPLARKGIVR